MRRILLILSVLICILFTSETMAQSDCTTITYYSKKDWVYYQNLFDDSFKEVDNHLINSKSIVITPNVFGTVHVINKVDSSAFMGINKYTKSGSNDPNNPVFFSIGIGKTIQVGKVQFQIEAINRKTKKPVKKSIYADANPENKTGVTTYNKERHFLSTANNGVVTVDFNFNEIGSIEIFFENDSPDNEYTLHSFQVLDYKVKEHVAWVPTKIENTEVKPIQVCTNKGVYNPDGTNGKWVKEASTVFSPNINIVSNYVPIIESRERFFDIGKTDYINAYSIPNIVKSRMGGLTNKIVGWTTKKGPKFNYYDSYGPLKQSFPYIPTSNTTGIIYRAEPRYWSSSRENNYVNHLSNDPNWCGEVTGSRKTPCYKHDGHSSNSRLNLYDVEIFNYKEAVDPKLRAIKKTVYKLINIDTNKSKDVGQGVAEIKHFILKETGRWKIRSEIEDLVGKKGSKDSKVFLIDNIKPSANFSTSSTDYTKTFSIQIKPFDQHSKVKVWKYSVSKDGGRTFFTHSTDLTSTFENFLVDEAGDYLIKAYIEDNAGNTNYVFSSVYTSQIESASIHSLIVPTYELNEETPIYLKIDCLPCKTNPKDLIVKQNGIQLYKLNLNNSIEEHILNFVPNTENNTVLSFNWDDKEIELLMHEKSREYKESNDNIIELKGIVASGISLQQSQHDYYESVVLKFYQDKNKYFTGEGIENKILIDYSNECAKIENFSCVVENDGEYSYGTSQNVYQEAAKEVDGQYKVNDKYIVDMQFDKILQEFKLPKFYLDKKEGTVYSNNSGELIDGGHKWYTNPLADLKTYSIVSKGKDLGVNQFRWLFNSNYVIDRYYYDTFRMRFVEPKNAFPSGVSKLWNNYHEWFLGLRNNSKIKQAILE